MLSLRQGGDRCGQIIRNVIGNAFAINLYMPIVVTRNNSLLKRRLLVFTCLCVGLRWLTIDSGLVFERVTIITYRRGKPSP